MAANTSQPGGDLTPGLSGWFAHWPRLTLVLAVLAALGPFLAKPFNFDDPLFVWTAKQIQAHPADPYGFEVNWYGSQKPMWQITKNPPLAAYYIAGIASVLGWRERALHLAFLLPAIAAILGTHRLAGRLCARPGLATVATLVTPAFLVSSTTVMSDTMMLAFWAWAVALWVEGLERNSKLRLATAAGLIGLAALTKYFGACLIPLLAGYSLLHQRRVGSWLGWLLIPVASLVVYESATHARYGQGLLFDAVVYARTNQGTLGMPQAATVLVALAFTGGGMGIMAFFVPGRRRARTLAAFAVLASMLTALFFVLGTVSETYGAFKGSSPSVVAIQVVFWATAGLNVLGLAVTDVWRRRNSGSFLLAAWTLGTFVFVAFFNWSVNVRSLLPMAPALGILLARRWETEALKKETSRQPDWVLGLGISGALALLVARADYRLAVAVRQSAEATCARYLLSGNTLWFEGHWGFQYYMEASGAKAATANGARPEPGDFVAIPINNSNTSPPNGKVAQPERALAVQGPRWLITASKDVGAGFYASAWGPLPFALGRVPPETVLVYRVGAAPAVQP